MKNKTQYIAVFAGIALVAFLLYGNSIMSLFNFNGDTGSQALIASGVAVRDDVVGTGAEAKAGDTLTVHYIGTLSDGKVFDSSVDRGVPFSFVLGVQQVIRGWDEGLLGMKEGGKRTLVIAPDYGYGPNGAGPIPPNSVLIFQVELIKVVVPAN